MSVSMEQDLRIKDQALHFSINAIAIADMQGIFSYVNPAFLGMWGYGRAEEVLGRSVVTFWDDEETASGLLERIRNGESYRGEMKGRKRDGLSFEALVSASPIFDAHGNAICMMASVVDISDRKKAERSLERYRDHLVTQVAERTRELETAKRQWETTFDTISDWVCLIDENHQVIRSNKAVEDLFGLSPAQVVGRHCFEVVHDTTKPFPGCPLKKALKSHVRESMDLHTQNRWFHVDVDPFDGGNGRKRFVHIVRDITDFKKQEKELLAARKAEAFSILSGGIAHDYNNLLSIIWGNLSLLREDIGNHTTPSFFDEAEKACNQAKALTHQFITLSHGAMLHKSLHSMSNLLGTIIETAKEEFDLEISLDIAEDLSPVEMDPDLMGVAIHNIITNAAEAMPGGARLEVQARIEPSNAEKPGHGQRLVVSFQDHGRGIPESDLGQVFDPYFTTKELGTRKGMGLGLAVSQSVLIKHGGSIHIDSTPNEGTTVILTLPIPGPADTVAPGEPVPVRSSRPTVLLMEDSSALRKLCQEMLGRLDVDVISVGSGQEAIERYRTVSEEGKTLDLVLLDQNVRGGLGGTETLKKLKAVGYENPAILVTGSPHRTRVMNYERLGFDANLLKPYTQDDLRQAISRFISL